MANGTHNTYHHNIRISYSHDYIYLYTTIVIPIKIKAMKKIDFQHLMKNIDYGTL